jgi:hypothetical protein
MPKPSLDDIFNGTPKAGADSRPPLDDIFANKSISQEKQKIDVLDVLAGGSPEELKQKGLKYAKAGDMRMSNLAMGASAIQSAGKDLVTIPAHFFNQLLLNAPRSIANTAGFIYPENVQGDNIASKAVGGIAKAAGVAGAVTSPAARAIGGTINAPLRTKALVGGITGAAYAPTENFTNMGERAKNAAIGAAFPVVGAVISKIPPAVEVIKKIPDKFFRGGLTKQEAVRVTTEYGGSIGSLVEKVKTKLNQAIDFADEAYSKVFQSAPDNKFINIKPAIDESGRVLKRLGLITEKGNLTELGNSEIMKDSTYGKILDFYQSSNSISGVEKLQGKALTQGQMIKAFKADRETLVNKDQYLFLRDKLNSLYKNKPSDIDVSKVADSFYRSGENSGLKGLMEARKLEREAFRQSDRFLNRKSGDLKIATEGKLSRIGSGRPLSQQEMVHVKELQDYIKHPIIEDARQINRLNRAKEILATVKKEGLKWGVRGAVGGTAAGVGFKLLD